jgi:hypothetical protein
MKRLGLSFGKDVATGGAGRQAVSHGQRTRRCALILQLVEEGKVDLDARASEYVKGIAHSDQYTVRQLIQHMSGLIATDAIGPAEALLEATHTSLQFEPGTGFLYSSPGYYMLGVIIEKVTGVPYTQALHERLLDPLGLSNTLMDEIDPFPIRRTRNRIPRYAQFGRVALVIGTGDDRRHPVRVLRRALVVGRSPFHGGGPGEVGCGVLRDDRRRERGDARPGDQLPRPGVPVRRAGHLPLLPLLEGGRPPRRGPLGPLRPLRGDGI